MRKLRCGPSAVVSEQFLATVKIEQRQTFNAVLASVEGETGELFGVDASGGTNKAFTLNLILAAVHVQRKITLIIAM